MNNLNDFLNNKKPNQNTSGYKGLNDYLNSTTSSRPLPSLGPIEPIDYGRDVGSKKATKYLPAGFSFLSDWDSEELQAQIQPWATKAASGAARVIVKAGTEVAKMPGVLGGLVAATGGQLQDWFTGEDNTDFMQVAFNNDWINNVEEWGQSVNENILPVYVKKSVRDGNLWDNITSIDFWATDGADGLGFILSMLVPGMAITKLGVGAKVSKLLSKMGTPNSVLKSTGFVGKGANLRTATFANTLFEAGVESNHFMQDATKELTRRNQLPPTDPEYISDEVFEQKMSEVSKYAAGVLGASAAILLGPNWIMSKMVYGGAGHKQFGKKLFDKEGKLVDQISPPALLSKERWLRSGQRYGKAALSEGFWEEGMQDTSSGFLKDRLLDDSDKSLMETYFDHITTTEGQKAIFLGAVFGGMMYSSGGRKADVRQAKQINDIITTAKDTFKGVSDYTDIEIYKTKTVETVNDKGEKVVEKQLDLDANGEPQLNPDGVMQRAEILGNMLINGKLYQQAVEQNDVETIEEFHDKALHKLVEGLALRGEGALEVIDAFVENSPEIQELINKQEDPARGKIEITSKLRKKVEEAIKANEEFQNFGDLIDVNHKEAKEKHYEGFKNYLNNKYLQIRNSLNYFKDKQAENRNHINEYFKKTAHDPSVLEGDNELLKQELLNDPRLAKLVKQKNTYDGKVDNYNQQEKDFWDNKKQQEEFKKIVEASIKMEELLKDAEKLNEVINDIENATTLEELDEKVTKKDLENPKIKELYDIKKQVIKEFAEATKKTEETAQKDAQENEELNEEEASQEDTSTKTQPVKPQTNPEQGNITQTEGSELHDETIPNGTEGLSENKKKEGSPLFKRPKLIVWDRYNNQFFDWISEAWRSFERNPKKKDGTPVTFQVNTKYGRTKNSKNWDKAVEIYNNKVVKGVKLTQEEISILENHLPINTHVEGKDNLFAPVETRPYEKEDLEAVTNFNENTKPLRKRIIAELIKNKSFDGIQGSIFKQFPGVLKIADKIDGKIPENNIRELDAVKKGLMNIFENIRVVLKEGVLQKPDKSTNTMINVDGVPVKGVGELYLMIPRADGSMFPLKLNIQKVLENQADVLADIYGFALETGTYKKQMKISELPKELQTKIGKQLGVELSVIKKGLNKTSKDITVGDLIDILIWDNTKNKKTKIGLSGTGVKGQTALTFGRNKVLDLKGENRDKFIQWITETKRRNVSFVGQTKNGVKGLSINDKVYLDYLLDNEIINTNAVVNEPTFQGYTNIYLAEDVTNNKEVETAEETQPEQSPESNLKSLSETGPFDPKTDTPGNTSLYPVTIAGESYFASPASGKVYRSSKQNIDLSKESVDKYLEEHIQDNDIIQQVEDDINTDEMYTMMGEPKIELNRYEEKTTPKIRKSQKKVVPLHKDPTTQESEQVNEAKNINSNKLSKLTAEQTKSIMSDLNSQGYFRNRKVMNVLNDKSLKGIEQLKKLQEVVNNIKKNAFDEILDKHCK